MRRSLIALFSLFTVFFLLMPQIPSHAEEDAGAINTESLLYDDRIDLTGKEVAIIDAGTPTSYQVGYGVEKNTVLDTTVVKMEGDTLIATGIGTAIVKVDGTIYEVRVSAAPISLLLLIGQSNMRGSEGNADQSIVCPDGMVYSSHGDDRGTANPVMTLTNARHFAASALAGEYCSINVDGTTDCVSGYPLHNLTDTGTGKIGLDSGLGYEWVKQTGEKVWLVNAAVGGTKIASWQPGASCYKKATALFSACQETLQAEISAGHYTLSHMGYFWCQGCSDNDGRTAEWYVDMFLTMHDGLKEDLAFDHDGNAATEDVTFEFAGIIPVRAGHAHFIGYRDGTSKDTTTAKYYESFLDLRFTGPRVAQYWLANNPDLPDVWNVCTIGDDWVWMPDGTNGVTAYFQTHYEGGTVDYTTQVQQSASWYTPTTPKAVHDSIHYNQIGYNELGRESARNALVILGEIKTPNVATTVKLLGWDGYTEIDDITAATTGASGTLVVPVVSPAWKSKSFTYTLSDGLEWSYYDLLAADTQKDGTLKIGGQTVTVHRDMYHTHLAQLPESICCGLNLWNKLEHDEQYFADGIGWSVHSSGNVYSVTIPVNSGDIIHATSFGAAGTNGNSSIDGIGITFFGEYNVLKSLTPAEVYSEFIANDGYLVVPHGAVAVNIPMWSNSDDNELFLMNLEHVIADSVLTAAPTCTEDGVTTHTCGICSNAYTEAVPAIGHTEETIPAVAPTCTETGLTKGTKCSACGEVLTAQEVVPAKGHAYDDGVQTTAPTYTKEGVKTFTCTVCGDTYTEAIPVLDYRVSNPYNGKVFSIMGDSISTFAGYIPTADGFNRTHLARYPQDNLLTDVYETWWMQTIVDLQAKLGINDSWRGATVSGAHAVTSGDTGENAAMSNLVRIQNLGSNGTPDVILFYGGTNDIAHVSKIGSFDPESAPSTVDLTTTKWDNLAQGYAHTLLRMKHYYPDATILALLPTYTASYYSDARLAQANETLVDICEYYGIPYIDLRDCGITADDLPDGIHPGEHGMDLITAAVIDALLAIDVPVGENVVYSVTHNLSNATASRGYYKGVSAGTSFEETLTGDNLSVTVTMGGKDITSACYSNGVIFIEKVTGALEITARSPFSLGDHLQEIPSESYNNTNLWQVLKPEKGYFKGAEWVNNYSSVTIPVTAGDQLWATSFGASGENGGSMNGIRVTYFDAYGMLATMEPDAVYEEFQTNGYLTVPEGATAVCVTMWTNTNAEFYLLTLPDGPVLPGSHLQEIPSPVCSGINLWQVLKPEKGYFKGATWVNYYSSVTIPVTAGDQLWATSFGASGENGGTINGIRVTYFDAHGMLVSLEATEVYEEFRRNGHITVPENAISVNVVMWNGDASDELYILNLEHSYDNGIETVAPACTTEGTMTFTCGICGDTYTAAIPATGHTEETIPSVAPTCTATGLTTGVKCSVCNEILTMQTEVAATGHSYDGGVVTTSPTCEEAGVKTFTCSTCKHSYAEAIPAKGHADEVTPAVAPTCTEPGLAEGKKCSVCGTILTVQAEVPALGHSYDGGVVTMAPSCNAEGQMTFTCTVCGHSYVEAIPATGNHVATVTTVNATCTEDGFIRSICAVCGTLMNEQKLPATGHSYEAVVTTPSCEDGGYTTYTCSACGDSYVADYTDAQGHNYNATVTSPTCTAAGYTTYTCTCGASYTSDDVAALGHSNDIGVETTAPTCTTEGVKTFTCTVCGNAYTEVIAATGHNYEPSVTGSTCTSVGYTTYTCSACGDSYTTDETPASGHSYDDGVVTSVPTCTAEGTMTFTCLACGTSYTEPAPATGHTQEVIPAVAPTCTETGLTAGVKCSACREVLTAQTEVAALGHTYDTGIETTAPTCTTEGVKTFTCTVCGNAYTEVIAASGHNYEPSITGSTCTSVGYTTYTCSACGDSYTTDETPAAGHSYDDGVVTSVPTCTAEGTMTFTCLACGASYTEPVPATGHTQEVIPAVAPTCTETGLTAGVKCSVCGEILTAQTVVAALGHTYDAGIETTAPTCTTEGVKTFTCTGCGNTYIEVIAATGHNYEPSVTGSTCTSVGYSTYTCSACGDSYTTDETPAAGHSYDDGVVTTVPTCTAEGIKTFTCSACDASCTEPVPATGHTKEVIPAVAPTCTETGLTAGVKCSVCGEILTAQTEVPALGHSYNSGVETAAPSCTAEGVKTFTCVGCGNSYTEVIPALGHTETTLPAVSPTCTTVGKTEGLHCNVCGTVFTPQEILPALGHTEGEPVITVEPTVQQAGIRSVFCVTCGELIRSESITVTGSLYIPGDADDNGCVDIYDALLVMQYSAGWDVTPNLLNADISKDGIVDLYDAVMILQYSAGTSFDSALHTLLEKAEELSIAVITILEHPQDQYAIAGQQTIFKLSAAGSGLQYQWYIDCGDGDGWRPIAEATSNTYTISTVQMTDDGCRYRCGITDASGRQIMSNPATLYVEPAVELPPTGDQSNLLLWTTLMAVSLCSLIGLVAAGKRNFMSK